MIKRTFAVLGFLTAVLCSQTGYCANEDLQLLKALKENVWLLGTANENDARLILSNIEKISTSIGRFYRGSRIEFYRTTDKNTNFWIRIVDGISTNVTIPPQIVPQFQWSPEHAYFKELKRALQQPGMTCTF